MKFEPFTFLKTKLYYLPLPLKLSQGCETLNFQRHRGKYLVANTISEEMSKHDRETPHNVYSLMFYLKTVA